MALWIAILVAVIAAGAILFVVLKNRKEEN